MKKLLVVVDFQNDFVTGSLGFKKAELLDLYIANKIDAYRKNGDTVVFTFDTHDEDYLSSLEGQHLPVEHCIKDTEGWRLYGEVSKKLKDGDIVFYKNSFGSIELFEFLMQNSFIEIEFVGIASNICVLTNVVLAKTACKETQIIVDSKAVASFDDNLNEQALNIMKNLHVKIV